MKQFLLALLMVALTVSAYAQDDETDSLPGLTLVSVQTLDEILGDSPRHIALSPDGKLLIYESWDSGRGLCVYRFTNGTTTCTPYETASTGENPVRLGIPMELNWSPDSRFVALTESSFINFEDGDIWVYDVENGEYVNKTQDNFTDNFLESGDGIPLDVLPIWSPDSSLYFFRYIVRDDVYKTEFHTIPAVGDALALSDTVELVADFSAKVPTPFLIYNMSWSSLAGGAEISPDGTKLALLMRPTDLQNNQLWIVDLADGSITLQMPTESIIMHGLPEWIDNSGFIPEGLTWVNDNALVLSFFNQVDTTLPWLAYHIDLETDEITPIFDFAEIPSLEEYSNNDADYPMPRFATVTPDGAYLLYANIPNSASGAALEAIPVNGGERLILHRFGEDFERFSSVNSIGSDGETLRAVLDRYLFSFRVNE